MRPSQRASRLLAALLGLAGATAAACSSSARPPAASSTTHAPTAPAASTSSSPAAGTTTTSPASTAAAWTTYQNGSSHLGDASPQPSLGLTRVWSAPLDGSAVFGQPLQADGKVVVATEDDDVYALDPLTGAVVWKANLGAPLRDVAAAAGCGDIDPLGVTSTPVIDPASGTVYAVGEVSTGGHPPVHHQLVAVDLASGHIESRVDADPPLPAGESAVPLLQRAALALANGRVYIGYGGQYGDCGAYHGWVVAVQVTGGRLGPSSAFDVTPSSTGGAVWDGGSGPTVGADGSVYVTTGNPNSGGSAPWAEAVVKLAPTLGASPEAAFQDHAAYGDLDLSTGGAVLLPGGSVFAAGKTDIGYLLRQADLGSVGTVTGLCGSDPDGGAAYDPSTDALYLPCQDGGIQEVLLQGPSRGWRSGTVNSTVVLAGGDLWSVGYPSGTIQELNPASGQVLASAQAGVHVPHFASLSVVGGRILVPTDSGVVAFAAR